VGSLVENIIAFGRESRNGTFRERWLVLLAGVGYISSKANQKLKFLNWQLLPIVSLPASTIMPTNDTSTSTFPAPNDNTDLYICKRLATTL
jgi:hypothetical protein